MKLRIRNRLLVGVIMLLITTWARAQEVSETLPPFREIKTFSGVQVQLFSSEDNRIRITGHSKNKVSFEVDQGRLEIRLPIDHIWSEDNTIIEVYGNDFDIIDANEGSIVDIRGVLNRKHLVLRTQEGAAIRGEIKAELLESKTVTGGRIYLEGQADSQEVEINTGGQYEAADLRTEQTTITAGTAGKGVIYVTEYCRATAKLGGTIEILGNPDKVDQKTSLGGKIL